MRRLGLLAGALGSVLVMVAAAAPALAAPPLVDFPVDGPYTWHDRWGHPRLGGRFHQGVDLRADKLTRLVAPWDGWVWDVDVQGGAPDPGADPAAEARAGNAITIENGGWTVDYFHINNDTPGTDDGTNPEQWRFAPQIRQGAWVLAGQLVGYVGDSGNAEDTPPHLHLELHDPGGHAVDPEPSVRAAGAGVAAPEVAGIALRPGHGHWVLDRRGFVHALDGAPHLGQPAFGWDIARDIVAMPDGEGYAVLDGYGGVHLYGSAQQALGHLRGPYWHGHDIGRALAVSPDGAGLVVLDGWGGVHRRGSATSIPGPSAYWNGWDIARDVALMPDAGGLVVLDGWGGLHASGTAAPVVDAYDTPWWQGWDIARAVQLWSGKGLVVLDGHGGLHGRGPYAGWNTGSYRPGSGWADASFHDHRVVTVRRDGLQLPRL